MSSAIIVTSVVLPVAAVVKRTIVTCEACAIAAAADPGETPTAAAVARTRMDLRNMTSSYEGTDPIGFNYIGKGEGESD